MSRFYSPQSFYGNIHVNTEKRVKNCKIKTLKIAAKNDNFYIKRKLYCLFFKIKSSVCFMAKENQKKYLKILGAFPLGDCVRESLNWCNKDNPEECGEINDYLKCIRDNSQFFKCDTAAVSCFTVKFGSFQSCYRVGNCQMCNKLSFERNAINALCNTDIGNNDVAVFQH